MKIYRTSFFIALTLITPFFLVGCKVESEELTNTQIISTISNSPTEKIALSTPTLLPSDTPSPTTTKSPSATFTPTIEEPTATPFPTIVPGDYKDVLQYFYQTNGDCELPCFWGIYPGSTTIEVIEKNYAPFGKLFRGKRPSGEPFLEVVLEDVPEYLEPFGMINLFLDVNSEDVIAIGTKSDYVEKYSGYALSDYLVALGQPTSVWTLIVPEDFAPPEFQYQLIYETKGIIIHSNWVGIDDVSDATVSICPQKADDFSFRLWDSNLNELTQRIYNEQMENYFYPLTDVVDLDLATFYLTYKDPDIQDCIEVLLSELK